MYPQQQPPFMPGPPYYPPPRRGNPFLAGCGIVAIVGAALFVVLLVAVAATDTPTSSSGTTGGGGPAATDDTTLTATRKAAPKTARIGDRVKDGKFTFTVTKITNGPRTVGNQYVGKTAQGRYLFVYVTVTNHGNKPQRFSGSNQTLMSGSREYEADTEAAIYLEDSESLLETINPGNTVKGIVVFDVPPSVKPERIELHDSAFSGGVTVALR